MKIEIKEDMMKKVGKIAFIVLICFVLLFLLIQMIQFTIHTFAEKSTNGFLSSTENQIQLYEKVEEEYKKAKKESRGTPISIYEKEYYDGVIVYTKIKLNRKIYYVKKGFTTTDKEKIIKEKQVYVRTNAILYYAPASTILCSVKKGTPLEITGYHTIQQDGSVDMYRVKTEDKEGYIYTKYVVRTQEEALLPYNENSLYDVHKTRSNPSGGSAANLDYYPHAKGNFSKNKMPSHVRALYINTSSVKRIDDYIKLAKKSNINAFVIDIKENELPAYASPVMSKYSETSYQKSVYSLEQYKNYVQKAIDSGFYVIGRISTFKDYYYALDHKEESILDARNGQHFLYQQMYWPTAYSRKVWEYNVELAKEAVRTIGFHEIQFDSIHFPEQIYSYEQSGAANLRNTYAEEKASAIQQFLLYARDELHSVNAYLSANVPGVSVGNLVTSSGLYLPAISNVVDVVSIQAFPDFFEANAYGMPGTAWVDPYGFLTKWAQDVKVRQAETASPATVRTWIQGFDGTKAPYVSYDAEKVSAQIRALSDSELFSGYMVWNTNSSFEKYQQISSAFQKEYSNE